MKTIVTVPTHLDNLDFLEEWRQFIHPDVEIIVMQDNYNEQKVKPPKGFHNVTVYNHNDVTEELGDKAWIIPNGTSACRSFAYYKAWQRKPDTIITLDTDCFPDFDNHIDLHNTNLGGRTTLDWFPASSSTRHPLARGFPYNIRSTSRIFLSHGLWSNIPDYDGATMLHYPEARLTPEDKVITIPRHDFFPMCGMNLAWRLELTPALYFGIFGAEYGFDQFDDIWAGVLVKKVMDHLGYAAVSGRPSVEHRKQSNKFVNLKKQAPGMAMNEEFWKAVRAINLHSDNIVSCYKELILKLPESFDNEPDGWTAKFKRAAFIWIGLFE